MYYRFPILFTIFLTCLGFAPNDSRYSRLELAHSTTQVSLSQTQQVELTLAVAPSELIAQNTEDSDYNRYMQAGYKAAQQRDYPRALRQFKRALAERPNDRYAQQAILNVETYQRNTYLLWALVGVGIIAVAVGGGLFLFFGVLRKNPKVGNLKEEPNSEENALLDPDTQETLNLSLHSPQDRKGEKIAQMSSKMVKDSPIEANSKKSNQIDQSLAIQQTTRLKNLDLIEELIQDLQDPDRQKRRKAIWDLAQKADSRAMKPLVDLMIDTDSQERSLILEALSQISTRTLKPMNQALAISLQDKNPQVRKNAIRDLTRIYDLMSQISQLLCHAIDDSDTEVQETAKWALNQLNLQMPPKLDFLSRGQNRSPSLEKTYTESSE